MTQHVRVFTHQRSGTHWICRLIWAWFYSDVDLGGIHEINSAWGEFCGAGAGGYVPWSKLFAGHHYDPRHIPPKYHGAPWSYVMRDGRDVAVSAWRLNMAARAAEGAPQSSFVGFIRTQYKGKSVHTNANNPIPCDMHLPKLWAWSTTLWRAQRPRVLVVHFEDMVRHPLVERVVVSVGGAPCVNSEM